MRTHLAIFVLALCLGSSSAWRPITPLELHSSHGHRHLMQDANNTATPAAASPASPAEAAPAASPANGSSSTPSAAGTPVATPAPVNATPSFASISEALSATSYLSTLAAALQASGIASNVTADTAWTILAPSNSAFTDRLATLSLTPEQLLLPENRATLVSVLQYHVIPSGAILSSQLTDGQQVTTTLAGAAPLTVRISNGQVRFEAVNNSAIVIVPDIKAGASVVHVINDVLLPAPTQAPAAAATPAPTGTPSPAATAANETAPVPAPPTTTEAAASPAPATTESPAAATTTSPVPAVSETYPSSISAESPSPAATTATNVSAVSPSPSATVVSTPPVGAAASPAP